MWRRLKLLVENTLHWRILHDVRTILLYRRSRKLPHVTTRCLSAMCLFWHSPFWRRAGAAFLFLSSPIYLEKLSFTFNCATPENWLLSKLASYKLTSLSIFRSVLTFERLRIDRRRSTGNCPTLRLFERVLNEGRNTPLPQSTTIALRLSPNFALGEI